MGGDGDKLVQGEAAGVYGLHDQEQGHDLGDAGGLQLLVGVLLEEDGPRLLLHEQGGGGGEDQGHAVLVGRGGGGGQEEKRCYGQTEDQGGKAAEMIHRGPSCFDGDVCS